MWMLVVFVVGMAPYTATYPTREACESAGRAKAIQYVAKGRQARFTCTKIGA